MFDQFADLLTAKEACAMLRVSRSVLDSMMLSGELPNRIIRGKRIIPKGAAIQWYLKQPSFGEFPTPPTFDTTFFKLI